MARSAACGPARSLRRVHDPAREARVARFLAEHGFALHDATPLAQDASFRRYSRLKGGAVLMDAPPPEDVRPFLRIAAHLAGLGLSVPRILAADPAHGLIIEEDLGDALFSTLLTETTAETLLDAAIDALIVLQRAAPPPASPSLERHGLERHGLERHGLENPDGERPDGENPAWTLPVWGKVEMTRAALDTLFDWWWPATHGSAASDAARAEVAVGLSAKLAPVENGPRCLVHRDFFAGNLLWLPDRTGPRRAGVIDFQGAALGHPAYDLVSLLQDARRDMPRAWEDRAIARYLAARPELDPEAFQAAYTACAAQRHLRVACQWARLALRDKRPEYLAHGPRTWHLLTRALTGPAAARSVTEQFAAALDRWVPEDQRRNPPGLTA